MWTGDCVPIKCCFSSKAIINFADLCPNAEEFLAGGEMTRAANDYQGRLKYKLFIGRLKKGFIPNQLYKSTEYNKNGTKIAVGK